MGRVEVLEPSTASGRTMSWTSWNTRCLSGADSKTASMTRSTPVKSAASSVVVIRPSSASASSRVLRPAATAFSSRPRA